MRHNLETFVVLLVVALLAHGAEATVRCQVPDGDWQAGSKIYRQTCITCHGASGEGAIAGAPDFRAGVLAYPSATLMQHIKDGFRSHTARAAMPPKGGNPALDDQDIKDVLAYLHRQFGCG